MYLICTLKARSATINFQKELEEALHFGTLRQPEMEWTVLAAVPRLTDCRQIAEEMANRLQTDLLIRGVNLEYRHYDVETVYAVPPTFSAPPICPLNEDWDFRGDSAEAMFVGIRQPYDGVPADTQSR